MKHSETDPARGEKVKAVIVCIVTFVLSAAFIYGAHVYVSKGLKLLENTAGNIKAEVTELSILYEETDPDTGYVQQTQYFRAKVLSGDMKGQSVDSYQQMDSYYETGERFVKVGDKVVLFDAGDGFYPFGSYARFDHVLILGIIFLVLLIVFGRWKGLSTVVSLVFTCLAVFYVFLPAVLSGKNIYLWTVIVCIFTIVMTLLLTNSLTSKSVNTMLGCAFGVMTAGILEIVYDRIMHLTGVIDEHSIYLQIMNENGGSIDLRGLIFAMITIGAMGAVMDVAMDISSSLYEVHRHAPDISFRDLFKSGLNIGRDVMGTMANTLVLAYIGSSLCSILLRVSFSSSMLMMLNTESICVELLQAILGSLGILLTIPLTTLVCCIAYVKRTEE